MSQHNQIAFKVSKQKPSVAATSSSTVINCRVSKTKRRSPKPAVHQPHEGSFFTSINDINTNTFPLKRKRSIGAEDDLSQERIAKSLKSTPTDTPRSLTPSNQSLKTSFRNSPTPSKRDGPTKLRIDRPVRAQLNPDVWFNVLRKSPPELLLKLRTTSPLFRDVMIRWPHVWQHSRQNTHGTDIPSPVPELSEFQYATLRHGHGCQSCAAPNTRKTYWAFLRRWCKECLEAKTVNDDGAKRILRDRHGNEVHRLRNYIPSGVVDSWGNFVGSGPAFFPHTRSIYLVTDLENILDEYNRTIGSNPQHGNPEWEKEAEAWYEQKVRLVLQRKQFADKLHESEEMDRRSRRLFNENAKEARRAYFIEKATELTPPIPKEVLERCPSYKRSIAIPKEPNLTSWIQLKPKVEAERAKAEEGLPKVTMPSAPASLFHEPLIGAHSRLGF